MSTHLILGAGPTGRAAAHSLIRRNQQVKVGTRSRTPVPQCLSLRLDDEPGAKGPKKSKGGQAGKKPRQQRGNGRSQRQRRNDRNDTAGGSMADALRKAGFGN